MKIVLDCASALAGLDTLKSITSADHASLELQGKDIWFSATGNNRNIKVLAKGEVENSKGDTNFGFNLYTMQSLLKGRKEVEVELVKNDVRFSSRGKGTKLTGEFRTLPYEEIEINSDDGSHNIEMSGLTMAALQESVKQIGISNLFTNDAMTLLVKLNRHGLYATVYDTYHLAYSHNSKITNKRETEFSIALPLWEQISAVAAGQDYSMSVGSVYVTVKSLGFEMSLPTQQLMEGQTVDEARGLVESTITQVIERGDSIELGKSDVEQTFDNLMAVNDGKNGVIIESEDGYVSFRLESGFGKAQFKHKVKTGKWRGSYTINALLFRDLLNLYSGEVVKLCFNPDMVVFAHESKSTRTSYSCVLIQ